MKSGRPTRKLGGLLEFDLGRTLKLFGWLVITGFLAYLPVLSAKLEERRARQAEEERERADKEQAFLRDLNEAHKQGEVGEAFQSLFGLEDPAE
ncbi:hypothetical protein MalM25_18350 [Planctomycetes bacterium MalM25]|nr:hypothetical protein MalM25_18350 [Planctomycetes bacterium MalM25]